MSFLEKLKKWNQERLMFEYNRRVESLGQARAEVERAKEAWERGARDVQALGSRDMTPYMREQRKNQWEEWDKAGVRVREFEYELEQIRAELDKH